jgi:hypothetical protein
MLQLACLRKVYFIEHCSCGEKETPHNSCIAVSHMVGCPRVSLINICGLFSVLKAKIQEQCLLFSSEI